MKTIWTLVIVLFLSINFVTAQDTLYIYRAGVVVNKKAVTEIDSVTFFKNYTVPGQVVVKDIDGNSYHTVKIGTQTWMVENLRTTKYRTGENIPNLKVAADWKNSITGTWCSYNNDSINDTKYGKLYNWYAVSDSRNIAPVGWHVASDAEWTTLTSYLGESTAGGKLKETGFLNWLSPNTGATNESGFRGLPGGLRSYSDGTFRNLGSNGYFWSNTQSDSIRAWDRELFYDQVNCFRYNYDSKRYGFSVRCVKDEVSTVTDIDGNVYKTAKIGTQTWMTENLRTTKYRNGENIPNLKVAADWKNSITGTWCNYNNDTINNKIYGKLYNWYAVYDSRNIAPAGWHVASDAEWTILTSYLGESSAGGKLKEAGFQNWLSPNTGATNESGFTGLPGGLRSYSDGTFRNLGLNGYFWSNTESDTIRAWDRELFNNQVNCFRYNYDSKRYGFSVRCIKDEISNLPTVTTTTLGLVSTNSAIGGGNITKEGDAPVTARGVCWSTKTNPTISNSKTLDGTGTGVFISTLSGLMADSTYYVRAYAITSIGTAYGDMVSFKTLKTAGQTVTDIDGNVYHTIKIGNQTWMLENLKTTRYNDSISIPLVSDSYQWISTTAPGYCWVNNISTNKDLYGALYNHYAVSSGKLAPKGWHVPTHAEIDSLASCLGGYAVAGSKLKESGNVHWLDSNSDATNSSGFTALPAGYRSYISGDFHYSGSWGVFWTSTESNGMGGRYILESTLPNTDYSADNKSEGFSVRCIKD